MMESIDQFIQMVDPNWVPWIVFGLLLLSGIGIALGEEWVIIPAAAIVAKGDMPVWPTLLAAYFGVVCGDFIWFFVCTKFGTKILHIKWFKKLFHPKRMLQAKYQFDRRGAWVIVFARFIPGSRTPTIAVAGIMHMPFFQFAIPTLVCCLITAPAQFFAGWWFADILQAEDKLSSITRLLGLVMVVVASVLLYKLWSRRKASGESVPRAKASWLRRFRK